MYTIKDLQVAYKLWGFERSSPSSPPPCSSRHLQLPAPCSGKSCQNYERRIWEEKFGNLREMQQNMKFQVHIWRIFSIPGVQSLQLSLIGKEPNVTQFNSWKLIELNIFIHDSSDSTQIYLKFYHRNIWRILNPDISNNSPTVSIKQPKTSAEGNQ